MTGAVLDGQDALRGELPEAHAARERGLDGARLDDFLLAVDEGVVNAVVHGGGAGRLSLWCGNGVLCCEVSDQGPGIPAWLLADVSLPLPALPRHLL
ncbi:ATP-binding protein [Nonomuraea rubra]|uniref:Anti-sigma regulatory factor (Ser/Thr protein kinase) n=1 Tax=Nonomuraea rubra TaxID=46180 RepID=A0A7X0P1J0_9ACTN|nr:ATP-binding protein [Nonomuraea rubra]MBB6553462.1 anti-sigma regulatory factor (Ser/Thr protein kinase) [Nonomuraea rubra]